MSEPPDQHVRRGRGRGRGRGTSRGSPSPSGMTTGNTLQSEPVLGSATQETSFSSKETRTSHGRDRKKPEVQIYVPRARRQQNAQDQGEHKIKEDSHTGSANDNVGSPGEQRRTKSGRRARPEMQRYVPRGRRQHVVGGTNDSSNVADQTIDLKSGEDRASERSPVPDSWDDIVEDAPHTPVGMCTDSPKASSVKKFKSECEYEESVSRLDTGGACGTEQKTNVTEERFEDSSCIINHRESVDALGAAVAPYDISDRKSIPAVSEKLRQNVQHHTTSSTSQLPNNSDLIINPETDKSLLAKPTHCAQKSDSLQNNFNETGLPISIEDKSQISLDSEKSEVNKCPNEVISVQTQLSLNSANNHSSTPLSDTTEECLSSLTPGESSQTDSQPMPSSPKSVSDDDRIEDNPMSVDSGAEETFGPSQEPLSLKEEENVNDRVSVAGAAVPINYCDFQASVQSQDLEMVSTNYSPSDNSKKQADQVMKECNVKPSIPDTKDKNDQCFDENMKEDNPLTNESPEHNGHQETDSKQEKDENVEVKSAVPLSSDPGDEEGKRETTEADVDQKMSAEEAESLQLEKMLKAQAIAALDFAPPADSASASQEEEEDEEDSWDKMFDDNGDCLDPSLVEELTAHVGKVQIDKPKIDYLNFQPKEQDMDMEMYNHIIEIYDFPSEFLTRDLITAFRDFMSRGFDIKWVDDTHALGVFASSIAAQDALRLNNPLLKVRSLSEASRQSKTKAKKNQEFLQPFKARPQTSASAARRLVSGALGLQAQIPREKREMERKQLKEAKEKRRKERKLKQDMWDGSVGRCAMDQEG